MWRTALLLSLVAVAACDAGPDAGPVAFGGVEVAPFGDAALAVTGGRLVVSGLDGTRAGGFALARLPRRLDVKTEPVTIPPGGRFGVRVEDAAGGLAAELFNESAPADSADTATLRFAFPDGVPAAHITYRLGSAVVFTTVVDLAAAGGTARRAQQGSAGQAQGKAGSVHVIRNPDGTYTLVSDSQDAATRGGTPGACLGFTIRPPVELPRDLFPDGTLCADWVEVTPRGGPAPAAARVSVTARGVGQFVVRTLVAEF